MRTSDYEDMLAEKHERWVREQMSDLYRRCPAGCDLGERDDGNYRWDCDTCGGMAFVSVTIDYEAADQAYHVHHLTPREIVDAALGDNDEQD